MTKITSGSRALDKETISKIIFSCKTYEERLFLLIGFELGMRRSDIVKIRISDINLDDGTITYTEKKKKNKTRVLPISESLKSELKRYFNKFKPNGDCYLFPNREKSSSTGYISSKTAYNIFNRACHRIGLNTPIPMNVMRSSCVKSKLACGWTIEQVSALIGDEPSTVIEHYATDGLPTPDFNELKMLMMENGPGHGYI